MSEDLEPGERRLALAIYRTANDARDVDLEVQLKDIDALGVVAAAGILLKGVPALLVDEARAADPRIDVVEGQLVIERQRAETLASQIAETRAAHDHEMRARRIAEQDLKRATSKLEELHKRPEVVVARQRAEALEIELERSRAEVCRLTAKLAETALAVGPNGGVQG
jgi:hypothetical protein